MQGEQSGESMRDSNLATKGGKRRPTRWGHAKIGRGTADGKDDNGSALDWKQKI